MKQPLVDYRVYINVDPVNRRVVSGECFDLRPNGGSKKLRAEHKEKEIIIRVKAREESK